jgi:hypothetical protein
MMALRFKKIALESGYTERKDMALTDFYCSASILSVKNAWRFSAHVFSRAECAPDRCTAEKISGPSPPPS